MGTPSFLDLVTRPAKPRHEGVTAVIDGGAAVGDAVAVLATSAEHIDLWKLGWASAYLDPHVEDKIALLHGHGVRTCTGGTLLEIAAHQDRVDACIEWAVASGFDYVEVSDGLGRLGPARKAELIALVRRSVPVIAEVGSKDPGQVLSPAAWASLAAADLDGGVEWVIAEGRESGTVGIYGPDGRVRGDVIDALLDRVGPERMLFEAPRKDQQAWFINHLGPSVNLSNVAPREAMGLEALRLGLRADTTASVLLRPQVLRA